MYDIAIIRKGQPAERHTVATGDLREAVYKLIRSEGGTIIAADYPGLIELTSEACALSDAEGFAALKFGTAAITIRPAA